MEKNLKRLWFVLLVLGLSAPVFAEEEDTTLWEPSQKGGFKVGIDALYLSPSNSDLVYATTVVGAGTPTTDEHNNYVNPSYDWGVYAQVGYLFASTGNDLTLGYTYLQGNGTDSAILPNTGGFNFISMLPLTPLFESAVGKASFNLNVIDLEGGQRFTTDNYDLRVFTGLRYADINDELQTAGVLLNNPTIIDTQEFKTQFQGLGPRMGADGRYCLSSSFGLDANFSAALLVGQVDGSYQHSSSNVNFQAKNDSQSRIVPVLEGKLGLDYTYIMDCHSKSALTFEAGYQVTNYFNANDRARVVNSEGTGIVSQNTTTDVAFDGIYFGVKYYA